MSRDVAELHERTLRLTPSAVALRRRLTPDASECPISESGDHETYGGICHCGWSTNYPAQAGSAIPPDRQELTIMLVAIEDEVRERTSAAPDLDPDCGHRWRGHGVAGRSQGCYAEGCACRRPRPSASDEDELRAAIDALRRAGYIVHTDDGECYEAGRWGPPGPR